LLIILGILVYNHPEGLIRFFTDLDRLACGLMIYRARIDLRIRRYGKLLNAIENNTDLYASNSPLQLTSEENKEILNEGRAEAENLRLRPKLEEGCN